MKNKLFTLLIFLNFFISIDYLYAKELKGTEFIATFLPNYHNNWRENDTKLRLGDSIYIFIYSEFDNVVYLQYKDVNGNSYFDTLNVSPNSIYTFKKPSYNYALRGYNLSGVIGTRNNSEIITNLSFYIKSEKPIIIYGHSQAVTTSESFNILPIEALGKEYIISAYNSSGLIDNFSFDLSSGSTPSQFALVAIEDNTNVIIIPSSKTRYNNLNKQNITLKKGEVYLVQSEINKRELNLDLTGTIVSSDKPVAVFAGHQRAAVPYDIVGSQPSRDYLVEQIPPLESWNLEVLAVPFPIPSQIQTTNLNDIIRIMAGFDNTEIYINGSLTTTLNKGKYLELPLNSAYLIKGSAPILVTAYKRTSQVSASNSSGDPLMQILPSVEQFGNNYKFISIQAWEYNSTTRNYNPVYDEHYITLIVHKNSLNSIELDKKILNTSNYKQIPNTEYYYGYEKINIGVHSITAPDNFGLFVCGYGRANSYGYFSGVLVLRDDFEPPNIQANIECYESKGLIQDKRISQVSFDNQKSQNVSVEFESFKPFVEELKFTAKLINKNFDGFVRIQAKDSIGQQSFKDIDIPGFTVNLTINQYDTDKASQIYDTLVYKNIKCYKFTLHNYGKFEQVLKNTNFRSKLSYFTLDLPNNLKLDPNEKLEFEVCFSADLDGDFEDTLFIENDCSIKDLVIINMFVARDKNPPIISDLIKECKTGIEIFVYDSLKTDYGIEKINIIKNENFKLTNNLNLPKSANIIADVIDPNLDAYLLFEVVDLAGYRTEYEKIIPGFTLKLDEVKLNSINKNLFSCNLGKKSIGIMYCDSIEIFNYGKYNLNLDNVYFIKNYNYSIPLNQLPINIPSGESRFLKFCLKNNIASIIENIDTLILNYNCLNKEIIFAAVFDSLIINKDSRCLVNLIFSVGETNEEIFVSNLYPNPAKQQIKQIINNSIDDFLNIKIYNYLGEIIDNFDIEVLKNQKFEITYNLNNINNGLYYLVITNKDKKFIKYFIVEK